MGFRETPEGIITFEDVTIDSTNEYPFKLHGEDARERDCIIHIRNYTVGHTRHPWKGAASVQGRERTPELTLVLHDWYDDNIDAVAIPEGQTRNDNLTYRNVHPEFRNDIRVAQADWPFINNPIVYHHLQQYFILEMVKYFQLEQTGLL